MTFISINQVRIGRIIPDLRADGRLWLDSADSGIFFKSWTSKTKHKKTQKCQNFPINLIPFSSLSLTNLSTRSQITVYSTKQDRFFLHIKRGGWNRWIYRAKKETVWCQIFFIVSWLFSRKNLFRCCSDVVQIFYFW